MLPCSVHGYVWRATWGSHSAPFRMDTESHRGEVQSDRSSYDNIIVRTVKGQASARLVLRGPCWERTHRWLQHRHSANGLLEKSEWTLGITNDPIPIFSLGLGLVCLCISLGWVWGLLLGVILLLLKPFGRPALLIDLVLVQHCCRFCIWLCADSTIWALFVFWLVKLLIWVFGLVMETTRTGVNKHIKPRDLTVQWKISYVK